MNALEDLVGLPLAGGGEIITQPTPDEHARTMELAQHFDWGFRAGRAATRLEAQNTIRVERARVWAEAEAEYVKHRRRFAFTFLTIAAIALVMCVAILYLRSL